MTEEYTNVLTLADISIGDLEEEQRYQLKFSRAKELALKKKIIHYQKQIVG